MRVAEGVHTVGEVEVISHLKQGLPVVDGRTRDLYENSTIPGARNIPYPDVTTRINELDREQPTIFFCNGPVVGSAGRDGPGCPFGSDQRSGCGVEAYQA